MEVLTVAFSVKYNISVNPQTVEQDLEHKERQTRLLS